MLGNVTETAVFPTTETLTEIYAAFNNRRLSYRPPNASRNTKKPNIDRMPNRISVSTIGSSALRHRIAVNLHISRFPKRKHRPQVNAVVGATKIKSASCHRQRRFRKQIENCVRRPDRSRRPYGDFHKLNTVTDNDRYLIRNYQDFNAELASKQFFPNSIW